MPYDFPTPSLKQSKGNTMSKKQQLNPKQLAAEHLAKLRSSVGKRCMYGSRSSKPFEHKGKINDVYDGGRGAWVTVLDGDNAVTVRPSQVKLY